jgi:hypothetical protein
VPEAGLGEISLEENRSYYGRSSLMGQEAVPPASPGYQTEARRRRRSMQIRD